MPITLIVAHPDQNSFNHAIAQRVKETVARLKREIIVHDLYAEQFDPCLTREELASECALPPEIQAHCAQVREAEAIVVVHPNWWGQPPAILKGWIDRVLRPGVAYRFAERDDGEGIPQGLLKAKTALIFNTSNTPAAREDNVFGDPLERLWKECIFKFCGIKQVERRMFRIMVTSTAEMREQWLLEVEQMVMQALEPLQ